uniref:Bm1126, isoform a n=1 Tax=Brugia malayi TaxID=6279 RepID=A0A1I9G6J1_BRUMA|nr:Bm1126, isoform a [Brugia malayi]
MKKRFITKSKRGISVISKISKSNRDGGRGGGGIGSDDDDDDDDDSDGGDGDGNGGGGNCINGVNTQCHIDLCQMRKKEEKNF